MVPPRNRGNTTLLPRCHGERQFFPRLFYLRWLVFHRDHVPGSWVICISDSFEISKDAAAIDWARTRMYVAVQYIDSSFFVDDDRTAATRFTTKRQKSQEGNRKWRRNGNDEKKKREAEGNWGQAGRKGEKEEGSIKYTRKRRCVIFPWCLDDRCTLIWSALRCRLLDIVHTRFRR